WRVCRRTAYMKLTLNGRSRIEAARARCEQRALGGGIALALAALALAGCRLDMHVQPKYLPYEPSAFFDDGRSARQPVPGTVARGQLRIDDHLYKGKVDGKVVDTFPFPITANDILRGQQRYDIY